MKNIKLISIRSELGAGTNGASMGPDAIKIAALDFGSMYFKKYKMVEVPNENELMFEPVSNFYAKRIKGIYTVCDRLAKEVEKTYKKDSNALPIILAGDHSTAIGSIAGIKLAHPDKRIGIVWIDAHADMHSPYTTPSGNMHGMPLAAVLGEDNMEHRINTPIEETVEYWNKLKNLGGRSPMISYQDLVMICIRDFEPQEESLIKKNGVKVVPVSEIRKKGVERIAIEALNYLDKCDIIYVSFDVDVMDSSISKGTGTPVPNGITEKEAGNLVVYLMRSRKICCFEIFEINPTLDKENLMAENAFEILLKATNQLNNDF